MTIVDSDDICVSNINRQIHAVSSTIGMMKADALKERMTDINPFLDVNIIYNFVTPENIYDLLGGERPNTSRFDCILDAADRVSDKAVISHSSKLVNLIFSGHRRLLRAD